MNVPRVFICYYPGEIPDEGQYLLRQLFNDLRAAGAEVITDAGRNSDEEFSQYIARALPGCQWIIFVQTAETLQNARTRTIFTVALKLAEQQDTELVRIIPTSTGTVQGPNEWTDLNTINIAQDYPKALEKMLFLFSIGDTSSLKQVEAPESSRLPKRISNFSTPSPTYDRPLALPPRKAVFRDMPYTIGRKNMLIGSIALASLIVIALISVVLINVFRPQPPAKIPNPVVGNAYFTSSELFDTDGQKGANDGINVILNNLTSPKADKSYYVWLLPDTQAGEANTIPMGKLSEIHDSTATLSYISPTHNNLLKLGSRILITEENSAIAPSTPTTDKSMWRYYAEIPQGNGPGMPMNNNNGSMNMAGGSQLDHLRHLLYLDPTLQNKDLNVNLQGGVAFWFHQNIQKVMLLAKDARDKNNTATTRSDAIKILDYIDGSQYVSQDIPGGTKFLIDGRVGRIGLLTLDSEHENPAGFERLMGHHLSGLSEAANITADQKQQINQINASVNGIVDRLNMVRTDATKLLANPNDTNSLNDLYTQSTDAYLGQFDPATGNRVGGAVWVYDHIQHLSSFTVKIYKS
ncbi:hypothetical protein KDA_35330 [Dictyobacter alpinus]|uniref:TIR domain-containing protein n=1 Tax=Dictyobacter alpinus TaxID=2014873 RepID=A0A402B9R7_9CHLR|nr:TIR domain-containing protein [Dictyobacter alpinus]GCE28049.1 hypothetical protein KDA_35330 [Dictyobacter alpinus]